MTEGKPSTKIIRFAIPLILSAVCQQLYNVIDSVVVGQLIGVNAFAALGATAFCYWLILSVIFGFCQGFGTRFGQVYGAKDMPALRRAIGNSIWWTLILGTVITTAGMLSIRPLLILINTPPDILEDACLYLYIVVGGGMLFSFCYNTASAVLRALGNSSTPLYAVILASAVNIALDLFFVAVLGMGVDGVAIATVIATVCSLLFCLYQLKKVKEVRPSREDMKLDRGVSASLLRLGYPISLRNIAISMGTLVLQYVINGYGTLFVAGTAAAAKYFGVMNLVGISVDGAMAVYVSQNYGARRFDRIKAGVKWITWGAVACSLVIATVFILFGRELTTLLVSGDPAEMAQVVDVSYWNIVGMAVCLPFLYLLFIHRSSLQGMSNVKIPVISGFVELAARIVSVLILPRWIGEWGVYLADGLGWITAGILLIIGFYRVYRKKAAMMTEAS